jgi:hypothetical protein
MPFGTTVLRALVVVFHRLPAMEQI